MYKRHYICKDCGELRREDGQIPDGSVKFPKCCNKDMVQLEYEQAVAAQSLDKEKRSVWFSAGGHVYERGGKRKWKAVLNKKECSICNPLNILNKNN